MEFEKLLPIPIQTLFLEQMIAMKDDSYKKEISTRIILEFWKEYQEVVVK